MENRTGDQLSTKDTVWKENRFWLQAIESFQTQGIRNQAKELEMSSFFKSLKRTADQQLKACDRDEDDAEESAWLLRKKLLHRFIKDNQDTINEKLHPDAGD